MLMLETCLEWNNNINAIPMDFTVKIKQNEKVGKYMDLARELKRLWNMKVKWYQLLFAFGMVPKGLEKRLGELEIRWKNKII